MSQFRMNPDIYDAIDLVSQSLGGLKRSAPYVWEGSGNNEQQVCGCMIGAAHFAGVYGPDYLSDPYQAAYEGYEQHQELTPSPIDFDRAHRTLTPYENVRLPWTAIARAMGVVRGAE